MGHAYSNSEPFLNNTSHAINTYGLGSKLEEMAADLVQRQVAAIVTPIGTVTAGLSHYQMSDGLDAP
jgi:hypothetical protein